MHEPLRQNADEASPSAILRPGDTCWKIARANRAKLLIDGDAYYGALRKALLSARKSVHIIGWDIDSRVDLAPNGAAGDAPTDLRGLLCHLSEIKPDLRINLLLWDYSTLYALEREPLPRISLGWATPEQIHVCLDDVLPLGASHHQKIVVIDDALAFCGGLDLTIRRWDTSDHAAENPKRHDPSGVAYEPFHDLQFMVDGEAAVAIAELAHGRWNEASCESLTEVDPAGDPWPDGMEPDFTDVDFGVCRTLPEMQERTEAREIENAYIAAIGTAERLIYIENQYMTSETVGEAMVERLKARPDLEAVLVGPRTPRGWIESKTMGVGRLRFMKRFEEEGVADRVRLVSPLVAGEVHVMVHAKLMVVDDHFLTVGSANLNNRSMGFDSECNLSIEAGPGETDLRRRIAGIRNRLLGEHLDRSADEVEAYLAEKGSAVALVDSALDQPRRLQPVEDTDYRDDVIAVAVSPLADPEKPIDAGQMALDLFGGVTRKLVQPWMKKLAGIVAVAIAFVALWRWTPLSEYTNLDTLQPIFQSIGGTPLGPLLILLIFVLAGFVFFPVTVLITLNAVVFSAPEAFAYSLIGSLASASAAYFLGVQLGRPVLRRMIGKRLNVVSRAVGKRGVVSVMTLRAAPVAPFTAINLVCGAIRIRYFDYLLGTALGMAPGIVVLTVLGDSIKRILENPTPGTIAMIIGAIAVWIALGLGFQKLLDMRRKRRRKEPAAS